MPRLNMNVFKGNKSKQVVKANLRPFHKNKQQAAIIKKVDHTAMIASFFGSSESLSKDKKMKNEASGASTTANTSVFRNILVSIDDQEDSNQLLI